MGDAVYSVPESGYWCVVFQYRQSITLSISLGALLPVTVTLPTIDDDDDEGVAPPPTERSEDKGKGKRRADFSDDELDI